MTQNNQPSSPINAQEASLRVRIAELEHVERDYRLLLSAFNESEKRFHSLLDQAADAIHVHDRPGRFVEANRAAQRLLGYTRDELLNRCVKDIVPNFRPEAYEQVWARVAKQGPVRMIGNYRRNDGTLVPVEVCSGFVQWKGETFMLSISHDITERQRTKDEMLKANVQLSDALVRLRQLQSQIIQQERLSAMGQMTAGIAHDFNNLLTPILGYSDFLVSFPDSLDNREETLHLLHLIRKAAADAREVIKRVRQFSHPWENIRTSQVNAREILEEAASMTQPMWKEQAQVRGVQIELRVDAAPDLTLEANQDALRDVFINLILNAIDAMPKGGSITLSAQPVGTFICFEVRDTGTGMTEEVRRHCMEPFFSTKRIPHGVGLGLSVAYGIIQRHHGVLDIDSGPGRGTTMKVSIPRSSPSPSQPARPPALQIQLPPLRVLVADDDPVTRTFIRQCLERQGLTVELAEDGEDASFRFTANLPDVVITDLAMPKRDGLEFARYVKAHSPRTPVVLLTGFFDMLTEEHRQPEHVDRIVGKPATPSDIIEALAGVTKVGTP